MQILVCVISYRTCVLFCPSGISGREFFLYKRLGEEAVLSCTTESSSPPTCSMVTWVYNRDHDQTLTEVWNGEVIEISARAARLSVNTDCSLVINNITAEDAGQYGCRQGEDANTDVDTYLSVLTSEYHFHKNLKRKFYFWDMLFWGQNVCRAQPHSS